jgi:hypothetical protein
MQATHSPTRTNHPRMTCYTGSITENTACFYLPGETHIHAFITRKGTLTDTQHSVRQYKNRHPKYANASVVPFSLALQEIKKAEETRYCTPTTEITEDQFYEALNILPPEDFRTTGNQTAFRMSEYFMSDINSHYLAMDGKYYTSRRRINRNAYEEMIREIQP